MPYVVINNHTEFNDRDTEVVRDNAVIHPLPFLVQNKKIAYGPGGHVDINRKLEIPHPSEHDRDDDKGSVKTFGRKGSQSTKGGGGHGRQSQFGDTEVEGHNKSKGEPRKLSQALPILHIRIDAEMILVAKYAL